MRLLSARKMVFPEIIDLCSDEEIEEVGLENGKHNAPSRLPINMATQFNTKVKEEPVEISEVAARRRKSNEMKVLGNRPSFFPTSINLSSDEETEEVGLENEKHEVPPVPSSIPTSLLCREFWKAGDYENDERLQSYPRGM